MPRASAPERWTCPACGRSFGRNLQGHLCVPTMPVAGYVAAQPDHLRPIFEAALAYLAQFPGLDIEAASVGLLVKRRRKFVELRPRRKWVVLSFILPDVVDNPRVRRTVPVGRSAAHYVQLNSAADFDDDVRDWIAQSCDHHA